MPISYQQTLVTDVIAAVSSRLYDNGPQWETDELTDLITEALQTWNALSQFWRSEMIVPLIQNQWWYDLRTVSGSLVPYTTTQSTIVKRIQSHLLEPPTPTVWTGSAQFSLNDIFGACQRRQNDTLGESACTITRTLVPADIVRRTFLPGTTIDIRRVAWLPASGFGYSNRILKQSDQWATRAYNTGYVQAGQKPPSKWLQNSEPPPSFDVDSTPPSAGQYEVLLTQSGPVWSVGNSNATFGIPDDWSWVLKWGALGDLLGRESNASDTLRAAYCRARYMEGIALLRMMSIVLAVRINDKPVSVGAVKGGDTYNATWQAKAAGAPKSVYDFMNLVRGGSQAGRNLRILGNGFRLSKRSHWKRLHPDRGGRC